jgi:hypothetical protein
MTLSAARRDTALFCRTAFYFNYPLVSTTVSNTLHRLGKEYQCVIDLCADGRRFQRGESREQAGRRELRGHGQNLHDSLAVLQLMDRILRRVRIRSIHLISPAAPRTTPGVAQTSAILVALSAVLRSSPAAYHLPSTTPPIQSPVYGCTLPAKTFAISSSRLRARARRQCTPGRMRRAHQGLGQAG